MKLPLIDEYVARGTKYLPNFRRYATEARRFMFDDAAAATVGRLLRDFTPQLLGNFDFVRAPYPQTYIEFPLLAFYERWTGMPPSEDADERIGYVMKGNRALILCTKPGERVQILEHGITFHYPQRTPLAELWPQVDDGNERDMLKAVLLWGGRRKTLDAVDWFLPEVSGQRGATAQILNPQVNLEFGGPRSISRCTRKQLVEYCFRASGDGLILSTLLLLLTRPNPAIRVEEEARRAHLVRGHRRVFHAHNVVSLHTLNFPKFLRKPQGHHSSPRLHDVRGHWRHYRRTSGCQHQWQPLGMDQDAWHCPDCNGLRRWIKPHVRGDATMGIVTKEYEVSP